MPLESRRVAYVEQIGKYPISVDLLIGIDRGFTETETQKFNSLVNQLALELRYQSMLVDPKNQEAVKQEKTEILSLFETPIYVREIPNEYSDYMINPWYLVYTFKGPIKIGWRKRVIEIDWSESDIRTEGVFLFPNEEVTIGPRYIHAYGYEKAKEYLDILLSTKTD